MSRGIGRGRGIKHKINIEDHHSEAADDAPRRSFDDDQERWDATRREKSSNRRSEAHSDCMRHPLSPVGGGNWGPRESAYRERSDSNVVGGAVGQLRAGEHDSDVIPQPSVGYDVTSLQKRNKWCQKWDDPVFREPGLFEDFERSGRFED